MCVLNTKQGVYACLRSGRALLQFLSRPFSLVPLRLGIFVWVDFAARTVPLAPLRDVRATSVEVCLTRKAGARLVGPAHVGLLLDVQSVGPGGLGFPLLLGPRRPSFNRSRLSTPPSDELGVHETHQRRLLLAVTARSRVDHPPFEVV